MFVVRRRRPHSTYRGNSGEPASARSLEYRSYGIQELAFSTGKHGLMEKRSFQRKYINGQVEMVVLTWTELPWLDSVSLILLCSCHVLVVACLFVPPWDWPPVTRCLDTEWGGRASSSELGGDVREQDTGVGYLYRFPDLLKRWDDVDGDRGTWWVSPSVCAEE